MALKIFIVGFMGSGKSHFGKQWAAEKGLQFYDLDKEIESAEGMSVTDIFSSKGEAHFRDIESKALNTFERKDNFILACGGGTPCFNNNMQWMNDHGTTVYLKCPPGLLFQRLENEKEQRPLLQNIPHQELMPFIITKLAEREPYYMQAHHIIEADVPPSLDLILNDHE